MAKELSEKHIGYDFKEKKEYDWKKKVNSKKDTLLQKTWLACHLNKNVGDITLVEKFPYCDLFTFSFPCFVEDTMVLTDKGYKKIQDIKVGTKVFTHLNRFRREHAPCGRIFPTALPYPRSNDRLFRLHSCRTVNHICGIIARAVFKDHRKISFRKEEVSRGRPMRSWGVGIYLTRRREYVSRQRGKPKNFV